METRLALDCFPPEKYPSRPFPGQLGCLLTAPHRLSPLCRLKRSRLKVRFCTNESQKSRADLVGLLRRLGFDVSEGEVTAPAPAACLILKQRGLRPHLLIHDGRPPGPQRWGEGTPFPAGGWGGRRGGTWPFLDPWTLGWDPGAPCWDPGPIHPGIIPGLGIGVGWVVVRGRVYMSPWRQENPESIFCDPGWSKVAGNCQVGQDVSLWGLCLCVRERQTDRQTE